MVKHSICGVHLLPFSMRISALCLALAAALQLDCVLSFAPSLITCSMQNSKNEGMSSRRAAMGKLAAGAIWAGALVSSPSWAEDALETPKIPEAERIKPPANACAQGIGGKCEELSEGNPLIQELQRRSAKNRLKYQKEELESYWRRNYKDFFDYTCTGYDKKCDFVENPDGTWTVGTKDNQIRVKERPPRQP